MTHAFDQSSGSVNRDEAHEESADLDGFDDFDAPDDAAVRALDVESDEDAGLGSAWAALEAESFRTGGLIEESRVAVIADRFGLGAAELVRLRIRAREQGLLADVLPVASSPVAQARSWVNQPSDVIDDTWHLRKLANAAPLLTAQGERELAIRYQSGERARAALAAGRGDESDRLEFERVAADGAAAKELFILSNLRLVMSLARKAQGQGLDYADLINEGIIGLTRAVEKFDHRRGYKFSTYATWWIRQSTARAVADKGRIIRLPVHVVDKLRKIQRARYRLEKRLGREPTMEEIAASTTLDAADVAGTLAVAAPLVYGDAPIGADAELSLLSVVPDGDVPVEEQAVSDAFEQMLEELLETNFSEREREVLRHRLEIGTHEKLTLDELGRRFDVTRERIRQIENQGLKKLRSLLAPWRQERESTFVVEEPADVPAAEVPAAEVPKSTGSKKRPATRSLTFHELFVDLDGLTNEQRAVVQLRYLDAEPKTVSQVAERLGVDPARVIECQRIAWLHVTKEESE